MLYLLSLEDGSFFQQKVHVSRTLHRAESERYYILFTLLLLDVQESYQVVRHFNFDISPLFMLEFHSVRDCHINFTWNINFDSYHHLFASANIYPQYTWSKTASRNLFVDFPH